MNIDDLAEINNHRELNKKLEDFKEIMFKDKSSSNKDE